MLLGLGGRKGPPLAVDGVVDWMFIREERW